MDRKTKIRVLHLVTNLKVGGIEKLVHDLSLRIDKDLFDLDICCVGDGVGPLLDGVKEAGVNVYSFGHYREHPFTFFKSYHKLLQKKSYDIIHSHLNHFSWMFLRYPCLKTKTAVRIVHYHNNFENTFGQRGEALFKQIGRRISWRITDRYANCILGISEAGLTSVYGAKWRSNSKVKRLYNGVPLDDFGVDLNKREQRRLEFGIRPNSFVIGHVGRFRPQKNHQFLVSLAERLRAKQLDFVFVLVGDGSLLEVTKQQVEQKGLGRYFIFPGARIDIPSLLQMMDIFVFPSLWEGFPLAPVEAQASGLPVLMSERVSEEVPVIPPSRRLSLDYLDSWVESCCELTKMKMNRTHLIKQMQRQLEQYSMESWVNNVEDIYRNALP